MNAIHSLTVADRNFFCKVGLSEYDFNDIHFPSPYLRNMHQRQSRIEMKTVNRVNQGQTRAMSVNGVNQGQQGTMSVNGVNQGQQGTLCVNRVGFTEKYSHSAPGGRQHAAKA